MESTFAGDVEAAKGGPGVSAGYFVEALGFEFDFERYNHFFKDEDVVERLPDPRVDLDTDAMSFMGNVLVHFRLLGTTKLRPDGVAGMGMIRAMFDSTDDQSDTAQNDLAFNLGGGALYSLNGRVGRCAATCDIFVRSSTRTTARAGSSHRQEPIQLSRKPAECDPDGRAPEAIISENAGVPGVTGSNPPS